MKKHAHQWLWVGSLSAALLASAACAAETDPGGDIQVIKGSGSDEFMIQFDLATSSEFPDGIGLLRIERAYDAEGNLREYVTAKGARLRPNATIVTSLRKTPDCDNPGIEVLQLPRFNTDATGYGGYYREDGSLLFEELRGQSRAVVFRVSGGGGGGGSQIACGVLPYLPEI